MSISELYVSTKVLTLAATPLRSTSGSLTVTVAGAVLTPLSVTRTPGMALSRVLVVEVTAGAPSSEYSASSVAVSCVVYVESALSTPFAVTVKSEAEPVLRAERTRRSSPGAVFAIAAGAGPGGVGVVRVGASRGGRGPGGVGLRRRG